MPVLQGLLAPLLLPPLLQPLLLVLHCSTTTAGAANHS
jgi:hypothetical protein